MSTGVWSYCVDISTENPKTHAYFSIVQARFWTFEHYINWICENTEPPIWTTCIEQFYESLRIINKIKSAPLSVRAYVKSLAEIMDETERQDTMEAIEMTYLALIKERQGKNLSKNLLHAQTNKKAYDYAIGVVSSKRQANKRKYSREQKKRGSDNSDDEEAMEGSVLFGESNDEIGGSGSQSFSNARSAVHTTFSRHEPNENIYKKNQDNGYQLQDEENHKNAIAGVAESMIGKVERTALMVDDVNLEETFGDYCNECDNIFDLCHSDIMDLRPASKFTEKIPEVIWEKFVTNTYPEYKISETWEKLIQDTFKQRESLAEWIEVWRGLYAISDKNESRDPVILMIKDAIYSILAPYIEAFKSPYNILKSGELGENQYNSQFVSPILNNTLKAILDINWRILEVPVESSKHRRNAKINPIIDKVLEAKRVDGLARLWQSHEEVFIYEQTGPPDFDDVTQLFIHDYKLVRTMRDVLNQRIILHLRDGISDHKDLASFGAFGHRTEVSLFWCTMHQKSYCLQEYGSFQIPAIWQDLPVLAEAIITCLKFFSFMKENVEKVKLYTDQKNKLFAKRKVHIVKENPPTPNRSKKQKRESLKAV
ncbi:unnamed protein product [Rhizophagus irregularis]|nr:unnamed protein product [Rhizophagus irregularis]CAB5386497.1 unnamed protein product [Rhizophagus irregularis]